MSSSSSLTRTLPITLLGLALPSVLARCRLPGLELPSFMSSDEPLLHCAMLLLVPWVNAAVLVELVAACFPSARGLTVVPATRRRVQRVSAALGLVLLGVQVTGLSLYLRKSEFLAAGALLPAAVLVLASLGSRAMAHGVSRYGIGNGWAVVCLGELLASTWPTLLDSQPTTAIRIASPELITWLSLAGAVALALFHARVIAFPRAARVQSVPTAGLLPTALTVTVLGFASLAVTNMESWVRFALLPSLPPPSPATTGLLIATSLLVVLASVLPRRSAFESTRHLSGQDLALAVVLQGGFQLCLAEAGALPVFGALLLPFIVSVFVVRDLVAEARLMTAGALVVALGPQSVRAAREAQRLLREAGIEHVVRGLGSRELFRLLAGFVALEVRVHARDAERAREVLGVLSRVTE